MSAFLFHTDRPKVVQVLTEFGVFRIELAHASCESCLDLAEEMPFDEMANGEGECDWGTHSEGHSVACKV